MSESVGVCCVCLDKFSNLDEVYEVDENNVKHYDKLMTCFPNEVWYKIYKICKNCIVHLQSTYEFILTCVKNAHERRETYETSKAPYNCNDCKKSFKVETRLKKHINDFHPITQPSKNTNGECKTEASITDFTQIREDCSITEDLNESKENLDANYDPSLDKNDLKAEDDFKLEDNGIVNEDYAPIPEQPKDENDENEYKPEDNEDSDTAAFDNTYLKSDDSLSEEEFTPSKTQKPKVLRKNRKAKPRANKVTFNCEYCSEVFTTEKYLRKHTIKKHTLERPYKCDQCDATYRGKDMLVIHKRKHTGETPFVCSVCGKAFKSSHGLFVHNQTHAVDNRYSCPHCQKGFKTLGNLRKHLICVHTKSEDYKYQCNQCGHKFPFKGHLEKHLIRHTGIKNFPCRICGKMFILKTDAELHIRRTHINDQLSSCEVCHKEFKSTEGLQKHLKTAHNIGNYKVQVHVKKLLCPYCPKMFPYNNKLQRHILTHTGEKPFKCNICTKGFRDKTDLKSHLKNCHQIIDSIM